MRTRPASALPWCVTLCLLAGCSGLLPKSQQITKSPWQTYREAQQTFDLIVPGKTTAATR